MRQLRQLEIRGGKGQATEIESILEERIQSGAYDVGTKLPTVRRLAEELGVSKNTTVRAYQALSRKGYLDLVRGSGAFIKRRELAASIFDRDWEERLDRLIVDAKRHGLNQGLILKRMQQSADHIFRPSQLKICFIECNAQDIDAMAQELRSGIGRSMEGILLSEATERSAEIASQFDIVVTSFFHLSQVIQIVGEQCKELVVGVNSTPDHAALLNLARLHAQVIGLVCEQPSVMETLTHIIQTYHPSAAIITALFDEESRIEALIGKADVIVVPQGVSKRLMAFNPTVPVISVAFTIEQQSIDFLAKRIRELEVRSREIERA